jgi:D-serine deaminase-like pyridoxal phosphate-dependent protein
MDMPGRSQEPYARYRTALTGETLPAAFVDLGAFDANVRSTVRRAGALPVRPASKSIRCVAALRRVLDADGCRGVLCLTADEAVALAGRGVDDLVVAYPTWEPAHVEAVARAVAEGARITLMVDGSELVEHVGGIATRLGVPLPVAIEVDLSADLPGLRFGVYRSPVRTPGEAVELAARIALHGHLVLDGLMGYEAQLAGVPDRIPGAPKAALVRALKRRSVGLVAERRRAVVEALTAAGHALRFVNGGGTGSLETTATEGVVTEVTAGSAFFAPTLFDRYDAFSLRPAAGFALRVTRRPAPGVVTALGGGYVASGAVGPEKAPTVWLPEGAALTSTEGAGEAQTPIVGAPDLAIGDPVFLRHAKAGELCERFPELLVVDGDAVVDRWPTYRGEGWTFL